MDRGRVSPAVEVSQQNQDIQQNEEERYPPPLIFTFIMLSLTIVNFQCNTNRAVIKTKRFKSRNFKCNETSGNWCRIYSGP